MEKTSVATTLADMIDELGKLEDKLAPFKADIKRLDNLKDKIKELLPNGQAEGKTFGVLVTESAPYDRLDAKKVQAAMSADWIAQHSSPCVRRSIALFKVAKKKSRKAA